MAADESLESIHADFLRGLEQITNAYNRLRAWQASAEVGPVGQVPVELRAVVLPESSIAPERGTP